MPNRAEPEISQNPVGSPKAAALPETESSSSPEGSAPMLDVHPLHRAPLSWKEFFLHIATISVGLLIAIGLEQSVEFAHRHHERIRLREDLRAEGLLNRERIGAAIEYLDARQAWDVRATSAARGAARHFKPMEAYPEPFKLDSALLRRLRFTVPSTTTWTVARNSGAVALLPSAEAAGYTRLNYFQEQVLDFYLEFLKANVALSAVEARLSVDPAVRHPDIATLDGSQLEQLAAALMTQYADIGQLKKNLLLFRDANDAVLDGIYDEDRMAQYLWQRANAMDQAPAHAASEAEPSTTPTR